MSNNLDLMTRLRQRMSDPAFLDRLAQTEIDPNALMAAQTAVPPQGMEALYAASPQQSKVPLEQRPGMEQPGMDPGALMALAGGMAGPQGQPQAARPPVGPRPQFGAAAPAQMRSILPPVRNAPAPSIGELLAGR